MTESTDTPYMNGRGTTAHTRKLVDEMWDALDFALIGGFLVIAAIILVVIALLHEQWWAWLLAIVSAAISWELHQPWFRAICAVRKHTAKMKAETEKRGKGWASS